MLALSLNIDNRKLGCGWRDFLVLKVGRKWVSLLAIGSMDKITMSVREYEELAPSARELKVRRSKLNKRLRVNAATYGASDALLREAIAATAP